MAKTLASQAKDGGSIPLARSFTTATAACGARRSALSVRRAELGRRPEWRPTHLRRHARRRHPRAGARAPASPRSRSKGALCSSARTFALRPSAARSLGAAPINGVSPPFPGQPVQGFSAVLDAGHGRYCAMPENGYGAE